MNGIPEENDVTIFFSVANNEPTSRDRKWISSSMDFSSTKGATNTSPPLLLDLEGLYFFLQAL